MRRAWGNKSLTTTHQEETGSCSSDFIYRSFIFSNDSCPVIVSLVSPTLSQLLGFSSLLIFVDFLVNFPICLGFNFQKPCTVSIVVFIDCGRFFCRMSTGRSKWTGSTIFQLFFIDLHMFFLLNWITLRSSIQDFCLRLQRVYANSLRNFPIRENGQHLTCNVDSLPDLVQVFFSWPFPYSQSDGWDLTKSTGIFEVRGGMNECHVDDSENVLMTNFKYYYYTLLY